MCLGAIIWANIRTAYFGNTAEDAARVGFRDDYIYRFIENGRKDDGVLSLRQLDRDLNLQRVQGKRQGNILSPPVPFLRTCFFPAAARGTRDRGQAN